MKKAYMYRRVSTQQQTEKFGLDVQKDEILKYASENDIEIAGEFADEGITGKTADRGGLQDMLVSLAENKDVKNVIVLNCSRLWRSEEIAGLIRYELFKKKVDIISVQEPTFSLYTSDPSTFLVNQIMQALASYDRMQINLKLAKGRHTKAKNGSKPCGTIPLGYKWVNASVEVEPASAKVVRNIFDWYLELGSTQAVIDRLADHGCKTSTGKDFSKQAVANILHNDFYIGAVRFAGERYGGKHETFIDKETFDAVQDILYQKNRHKKCAVRS